MDLVAERAQLANASAWANDVQVANGGKCVNRAGSQALQKSSALSSSAGILYVIVFVAGLLVGHFFVCHLCRLPAQCDALANPGLYFSQNKANRRAARLAVTQGHWARERRIIFEAFVHRGAGEAGDRF